MSMPGDAAPSGRKDRGLTAASSSAIAQAIDFPDISHAMPEVHRRRRDEQNHGRCGRHCRNVRGLDTF
jgi:hypothetical protein